MTREITAKKILTYIGMFFLFVIIVGYGIWRSRDLLFGIRISVSGISDGMASQDSILTFSGMAKHATAITIDGGTVPLSDSGAWQDTLALSPGYNVVTITASDKFGRTIKNQYRVFYKMP